MGGQCGENAIVGSWLVFPHQGQCEDGQAVGDDGCTWKVTGFKVVEIQPCFNSTAAVLAAAFEAYQLDWQNAPFSHVMDRGLPVGLAECALLPRHGLPQG